MKKHSVNMLSGSITKGLISMFIPIMITNVFSQIVNIIDMTVLSNLSTSPHAVGAVGTCGSLITVITGLVVYVPTGANAVIARCIGANDQEGTDRTLGTSLFFALFAGIFLAIIGVIFAEPLLKMINCPDTHLREAVIYFRLYFVGVPFLLIYSFSANALRSIGDTKRPMYFMTACGFLKIALNLFVVGVLKLSVEGVALATIASWVICGALCLRILIKGTDKLKLKFKHFRFYPKEIGRMLYIGVPQGFQSVMYSFANVAITATVNALGGTDGIAIANQFDGLMYQIAMAPSIGVLSYVSQNIAAKNVKRAKQAVSKAITITIILGAGLGSLMAIFSSPLCQIMTKDPSVIYYAQQKMVLISPLYFLHGIAEIFSSSLRAMKKPITPVITSMIFMCAIRFPWTWYIFPLFENLTFLYCIWPIGWILSIATLAPIYLVTIKKEQKKLDKLLEEEQQIDQTPQVA